MFAASTPPFPPGIFRPFHILQSSTPFRLYPVRRSLHFLCLFRVFAAECHNFRESLRFGRRWVEARTANPHQTNRLQKTCREPWRNPRRPPLLSFVVVVIVVVPSAPQRFSFVALRRARRSSLLFHALLPRLYTSYFITLLNHPLSRCKMQDSRELENKDTQNDNDHNNLEQFDENAL